MQNEHGDRHAEIIENLKSKLSKYEQMEILKEVDGDGLKMPNVFNQSKCDSEENGTIDLNNTLHQLVSQ